MRAGVVIYTLDPRGLVTGGTHRRRQQCRLLTQLTAQAAERRMFLLETQETLIFLAEQTGGLRHPQHQRPGAAA